MRQVGQFVSSMGEPNRLAAEMATIAIPVTVSAAVPVAVPVAVVVAIEAPVVTIRISVAVITVAIKINAVASVDKSNAHVVPGSGNPVAVAVVARYPCVSCTRARRNVGRRPTDDNPELGCLGRGRSKAQPASHYRCTQHKFAKVFHNSSGPSLLKPFRLPGLGSLALAASCRAVHGEYKHVGWRRLWSTREINMCNFCSFRVSNVRSRDIEKVEAIGSNGPITWVNMRPREIHNETS